MSEQIFVGLAPTTPEGKEIFFMSLDDWAGVAECILNVIDPGFPFRPTMEAKSAIKLASTIQERLDNGACAEFFEWYADEFPESGAATAEERRAMAEWGLELMNDYVTFLKGCGGCKPSESVGLNPGSSA